MNSSSCKNIIQQVETEVLPEVDVIVAGGGTAGVVAALAAARNGARVTLIERYGYLGGMLTAGNAGLTMYTKYSGKRVEHDRDEETLKTAPEEIQIVGGIPREITERLLESGMGRGNSGTFGSYVFTSSEDFKRLLFDMMKEARVKLRLHSLITDVIREGDLIKGVVLESKSGRQFLPAGMLVDATGDGDVAARSGVPFTVGVTDKDICATPALIGNCAVAGVMFKVGNVDLAETFAWLEKNPEKFVEHPFARFSFKTAKRNFECGETCTMAVRFSDVDSWFHIYNTPCAGVVTLCCPNIKGVDGCSVEQLTDSEMIMADMVGRWVKRIKSQTPGFEKIFLLDCPQIGIRETRHIQGEYLLTLEDIYHSKSFPDCIGRGSHPIDAHPRPAWLNAPEDAYPARWSFEIPYRSLVARGVDNLLVAGRCISATHEAFGCIRPTVQCMITGEAAGTAAALAFKAGIPPRKLNVKRLRSILEKNGVVLSAEAAVQCDLVAQV
jgi:hypothetical protein